MAAYGPPGLPREGTLLTLRKVWESRQEAAGNGAPGATAGAPARQAVSSGGGEPRSRGRSETVESKAREKRRRAQSFPASSSARGSSPGRGPLAQRETRARGEGGREEDRERGRGAGHRPRSLTRLSSSSSSPGWSSEHSLSREHAEGYSESSTVRHRGLLRKDLALLEPPSLRERLSMYQSAVSRTTGQELQVILPKSALSPSNSREVQVFLQESKDVPNGHVEDEALSTRERIQIFARLAVEPPSPRSASSLSRSKSLSSYELSRSVGDGASARLHRASSTDTLDGHNSTGDALPPGVGLHPSEMVSVRQRMAMYQSAVVRSTGNAQASTSASPTPSPTRTSTLTVAKTSRGTHS
ncbi:uncharacterized protein LOC144741209 [Lampetra planeri]